MLEDSENADVTTDNLFKLAGYDEFRLSKLDEDNISDIERSLGLGLIDEDNKKDILIYLEKLLSKIQRIKNQEKPYEGDENINMDEYIGRISFLLEGISKI